MGRYSHICENDAIKGGFSMKIRKLIAAALSLVMLGGRSYL